MANRGHVVLQTCSGDPKEVARYLHYRSRLLHPDVVASDTGGEFSYMGRYCPIRFTLAFPVSPNRLEVDTSTPSGVDILWFGALGKILLDDLAADPIWGPDWLRDQRVSAA